jgi:alkane 1-monooxygenase
MESFYTMPSPSPFRYLSVLTLPLLVVLSTFFSGWASWIPVLYLFGIIPLLELLLKPDPKNHDPATEARLLASPVFDWLLYLAVPVQVGVLLFFLMTIATPGLSPLEVAGRIVSMGIMCGVFGINIAHELGHRPSAREQFMAKVLLLSSLYMHFFIEHNRGHHKRVATAEDPASAWRQEVVYPFWWRSIRDSYRSAWTLEAQRLRKKGLAPLSLQNEMLRFQLLQGGLLLLIALLWGPLVMLAFAAAALVGILLLETVNYIEHWGLSRQKTQLGYERVQPHHSWNSDHLLGRIMLFELSRHSDHHYKASRKYQILRHLDSSPQMPTGYPGMILLALFPPLWFGVMNARLEQEMERQRASQG